MLVVARASLVRLRTASEDDDSFPRDAGYHTWRIKDRYICVCLVKFKFVNRFTVCNLSPRVPPDSYLFRYLKEERSDLRFAWGSSLGAGTRFAASSAGSLHHKRDGRGSHGNIAHARNITGRGRASGGVANGSSDTGSSTGQLLQLLRANGKGLSDGMVVAIGGSGNARAHGANSVGRGRSQHVIGNSSFVVCCFGL